MILEEGFGQVRPDIGQVTQVNLVANDSACCRRECPQQPCTECEGIDISDICLAPVNMAATWARRRRGLTTCIRARSLRRRREACSCRVTAGITV